MRIVCSLQRIVLTLLIVVSLWRAVPARAATILLVTQDSTINASETSRKTQFESWGFTVTTIWDADTQTNFNTAVAGANVIYVPETVQDYDLGYKIRTATIGIVSEQRWWDEDIGVSTNFGSAYAGTQINVTNNSHAITAGLNTGMVTIFSSSQTLGLTEATYAGGLQSLANQNSGKPAVTYINAGGALANTYNGNSTASGRRARLPFNGDNTFNWGALNTNGLRLVHNALDWALNDPLLLHYKLDETSGTAVNDSSAYNRDGTVTGSASWTSAIRSNGFNFNGSTRIQVTSELGLPSNVSMAAWVDVDALDTSGSDIISIGDHVVLRVTSTAVQAVLYDGATWNTTSASFSPAGAGWHHYAFTFDDAANQLKIYIDGQLVTTATVNISISYNGQGTATVVGRHGNSGTSNDLDGRVDDVRVYNTALTQAQIAVLYGLVGHFKLNETAGTSAADSSGAGNAATLTGTATWTTAVRGNGQRYNYSDGDDYITITNSTSLQDLQEEDYSLAMWFKPASIPPGTGFATNAIYAMVSKSNALFGLGYTHDQQFLFSHTFSDASYVQAVSSGTCVPGSFYHVIVVFKRAAGTLELYINGQLQSTQSFTANKAAAEQGTTPFRLGIGLPGSSTYKFAADGTMDDVRIYNRAITSQEIALLYGTAGHWKMDEASGTLASDNSGAGNHGTYMGSPTLGQTAIFDTGTLYNNATLTEYLSLPRSAIHEASTVSVSFWIKTTYTGEQAIVSGNRAGLDNEFLLHFFNSTTFRIYCHANMQGWTIPSVADGNWHHFVVISQADTNTTTLYVDNVSMGSRATSAGSTPFSIDTGGLIVAQEQDSVGGSFSTTQCLRGTLDDLRIYQRTLSTSEINQLYGLMGRWAFSDGLGVSVADSWAGLNATISDGTWTSDCAGNTALDLDGVNDAAATSSSFDPPKDATVALWFRSAGPPAARQRLWGNGGNFEMWQDPDGLVSCDVATDGFQGGFITDEPLDEPGRWYHLVAQYDVDTNEYSIYLNGELHKSGVSSWASDGDQPAGILSFGTRTGTTEYFEGSIRDFRVYSRAMLASEIAQAAGMIGHWQLNESSGMVADDLGVIGNDATYVGSPSLGADGSNPATNGTAVALNGTSQYLTTGKSLLNGLAKFSLCAWIRPDSLAPDKSFLGQNGLIELGIDTSTDRIDLWTTAGGSLSAVKQLPIAKWSHIAAVGDGAVLRIYVNGIEIGSGGSATANYGSNSSIFKIGEGVLAASGDHFDGRMDDIRVYSRALCPEEIVELYQGGRPAGIRIIEWVETR